MAIVPRPFGSVVLRGDERQRDCAAVPAPRPGGGRFRLSPRRRRGALLSQMLGSSRQERGSCRARFPAPARGQERIRIFPELSLRGRPLPSFSMPYEKPASDNSVPKPLRHCPVCGLAMVASKAQEGGREVDVFQCLRCGGVIAVAAPAPGSGKR